MNAHSAARGVHIDWCKMDSATREPCCDLSIVIPAYNEERRLPQTLHLLRAYLGLQRLTAEVLVVDDGSSDGTATVVEAALREWPQLRLLGLPHRGKGSAVRAGMLAATGRVRFLADADLSMPPHQLSGFLELLAQGAQVVVGSREGSGARRIGEPAIRHALGRVFNRAARALGLTDLPDTQCGFKAFIAAAADRLFAEQTVDGFAFDLEILYLAKRHGYRIAVLPIEWCFDADSRVSPLVDSLRMLKDILVVRLRRVEPVRTLGVERGSKSSAAV